MHGFFSISLSIVEGQNKAKIQWPDYSHKTEEWFIVENELAFTAFALSKMPVVIKSILKRYAKQRFDELEGTECESKSKDLITYCSGKELNSKKSLSDVCLFVNKHRVRIEAIIPSSESKQTGWISVIDKLLVFCANYTSGQAGPYLQSIAKQHFNPQKL
jgi:hypothetical protein